MNETFYDHFAENMALLHLPAPRSLFESLTTAIATTVSLARAVDTYGPRVTVQEVLFTMPTVFSAKAALEIGAMGAAITAAFYVGACIGSIAVATGKSLALGELLAVAGRAHIAMSPWLVPALQEVTQQHIRVVRR